MGYRWDFIVRGKTSFPLDMLRYDACYPADQEAVCAIEDTERTERTVKLRSRVSAPTDARWSSFGWQVVNCDKART